MKRYQGIIGRTLDGARTWHAVVQVLEPNLIAGVEDESAFQPKLKNQYDLPWHVKHSPSGHSWGYLGSGPAELAKDILWDHLGAEPPPATYQAFKEDFVGNWDIDSFWELDSQEIDHWLYKFPDRCDGCSHSWGEHLIRKHPSGTGSIRCAVLGCNCERSWSDEDVR